MSLLIIAVNANAGNLTSLKVDSGLVYFSTDDEKSVASPSCVALDNSDKWTMSLNTETGKAAYAILITATAKNSKVTIESANDCADEIGFERAKSVAYVYGSEITGPALELSVNPKSCDEIYQTDNSSLSGTYDIYLESEGGTSRAVYCDMTSEGGWTLVMRGMQGDYTGWLTDNEINVEQSRSYEGSSFKLSDDVINELVSQAFKVTGTDKENHKRYFKSTCVYSQIQSLTEECAYSYSTISWQDKFGGYLLSTFRGLGDFAGASQGLHFNIADARTNTWFVGNRLGYKDADGTHWSTGGSYTGDSSFWVWVK